MRKSIATTARWQSASRKCAFQAVSGSYLSLFRLFMELLRTSLIANRWSSLDVSSTGAQIPRILCLILERVRTSWLTCRSYWTPFCNPEMSRLLHVNPGLLKNREHTAKDDKTSFLTLLRKVASMNKTTLVSAPIQREEQFIGNRVPGGGI